MLRLACIAAILMANVASLVAAPVSLKELELMVRMGISEQEILRDVGSRKLLVPLDGAAEKTLGSSGASANLIQQLKGGSSAISSAEAAKFQEQQARSRAAAASDQPSIKGAMPAPTVVPASAEMRAMFEGKLQKMENGTLRAYSADELRNVRYFALYYSAHWCGPCRKFTPELIKFYQGFKPQHPEFEVVFISCDYNPAGMQEYMKTTGMPWPAVQFEKIDSRLRSLAGQGIPWLGIYNDAAQPVTSNGKTKQWADPSQIIVAFEQAMARPNGR